MEKYTHGGNIKEYESKYGRLPIDFSANINPLGMPSGVKEAYINAFEGCKDYPDPNSKSLVKAISIAENMPEDFIMCGSGADGLIFRIMQGLKPKNALLLAPTFSEYEKALKTVNAKISYYELKEDNGYVLDKDIVKSIKGNDIFIMPNPNNPTGVLADKDIMVKIAEICKEENCVFAVDECFIDFAHNPYSVKELLVEFPNIILIKAFTKMYAMPGLRLGYIITSNSSFLNLCKDVGQHWGVSYPAQVCGEAALKDKKFIEKTKTLISEERSYLTSALLRLGFKVYNSTVNYIMFSTSFQNLDKSLEREGFMIRNCRDYRKLTDNYYRVAVKLRQDNMLLIAAMERCLKHG